MIDNDVQGIYMIVNTVNGKKYIGSSSNVKRRLRDHLYSFRSKSNFKNLQNDFEKFGEESFKFKIIEEVNNKDILKKREDYYIEKLNTMEEGYNLRYAVPRGRNSAATVLNDKVYSDVISLCETENVSLSSWIREAILEKLERTDQIEND